MLIRLAGLPAAAIHSTAGSMPMGVLVVAAPSGRIAPMALPANPRYGEHAPSPRPGGKFAEEVSPFGISRTHLRGNVRETPGQRLDRMVDAVRFGLALRAGREGGSPPPLDVRTILCALVEAGVNFVLIGGWAETIHGSTAGTEEVAVLVEPGAANDAPLQQALGSLAARPKQAQPDCGAAGTWETAAGRLVVWITLPTGPSAASVRQRAVQVDLGNCRLDVAALDDLERMLVGATTGLPLIRLEALRELRRLVAPTG